MDFTILPHLVPQWCKVFICLPRSPCQPHQMPNNKASSLASSCGYRRCLLSFARLTCYIYDAVWHTLGLIYVKLLNHMHTQRSKEHVWMTKQSFFYSRRFFKKKTKQKPTPEMKIENPITYLCEVTLIWAGLAFLKRVRQVNSEWLFSRGLEVWEFLGRTFSGADLWARTETPARLWTAVWTERWKGRCGRRKAAGGCLR